MLDSAMVIRAFPLGAPLVTTAGAGESSPRALLITRVVRSPREASPELGTSPRSRKSVVAPALIPAVGTSSCTLDTGSRLEGA
jgi:hypothetical protein